MKWREVIESDKKPRCKTVFDVAIGDELRKSFLFLDMQKLAKKVNDALQEGDVCLNVEKLSSMSIKEMLLHTIAKHVYKFDKYKSTSVKKKCLWIQDNVSLKDILQKIKMCDFIRDFENEPSNIITPETFCSYVEKTLRSLNHVNIKTFDDRQCKDIGLNLVVAMGNGSVHPCRFLIIEYMPLKKEKAPLVGIVGKGVTFDTGGNDLKTGKSMSFKMKADKTGGCIVVGLIKYLAEKKIARNVVGFIPLIDNSVSGSAVKPGDIIRSYNGKTVEILNTDAEGRLIMADAFGYACDKYDLDYLIDLATLTGWSEILHCDHVASYFCVNKKIADMVYDIGERIGERVVALPRWPEYSLYTKSDVADYKNYEFSDCVKPGGFMASMFLWNFVPEKLKQKWIHFDITNDHTGHYSNGNCALLTLELLLKIC
jgi:leucyl aminopeptidase